MPMLLQLMMMMLKLICCDGTCQSSVADFCTPDCTFTVDITLSVECRPAVYEFDDLLCFAFSGHCCCCYTDVEATDGCNGTY